jgi:hypothetical protein
VSRPPAFTSSSDLHRVMPASAASRLDGAHAALASLREEERRLERLGLLEPLRRCREQLRYWEFLAAIFSLQGMSPKHARPSGRSH